MREVHELAAVVNILMDLSRNKRNARVPWPDGLLGVAVEASPLNDPSNRQRRVEILRQSSSSGDWDLNVVRPASCQYQHDTTNNGRSDDAGFPKCNTRSKHAPLDAANQPKIVRRLSNYGEVATGSFIELHALVVNREQNAAAAAAGRQRHLRPRCPIRRINGSNSQPRASLACAAVTEW
jgi:hypothetical protein